MNLLNINFRCLLGEWLAVAVAVVLVLVLMIVHVFFFFFLINIENIFYDIFIVLIIYLYLQGIIGVQQDPKIYNLRLQRDCSRHGILLLTIQRPLVLLRLLVFAYIQRRLRTFPCLHTQLPPESYLRGTIHLVFIDISSWQRISRREWGMRMNRLPALRLRLSLKQQ